MHGLINRTIQRFVSDTYGEAAWLRIGVAAELGFADFEAMLFYEDGLTFRVLDAVCEELDKTREEVLEDIGTYLVSHPNAEAVRRLLRFGGEDFVEFLHSLDDLPDRARLAVADLELPQLELREHAPERFTLTVRADNGGFGHVMIGMLRSLADDYGALVLLEQSAGWRANGTPGAGGEQQDGDVDNGARADERGERGEGAEWRGAGGPVGREVISITLVDAGFAAGRDFELGAVADRRVVGRRAQGAARGGAAA